MHMSLRELWELVVDREAWHAAIHGIFLARITEEGCHFLLQGIFPTQESNPGLLHCRWILYQLNYKGSLYDYLYQ